MKKGWQLVFALVLLSFAKSWDEMPAWRVDGTRALPAGSLAALLETLQCPPRNSRLAIYGDSHVAGARTEAGPSSRRSTFGTVLADNLPGDVNIVLNAVGRDTAAMGEERWLAEATRADLVLLAYGTDDAAPVVG